MRRKPSKVVESPVEEGLRDRKKRATRDAISAIATGLFVERGFENVTITEIAAAANVSKMTVFNYFPRKEDMFFDREDEGRELFHEALSTRGARAPVTALRELALRLIEERHAFAKFEPSILTFWQTVDDSPSLRARVREMQEQLQQAVAAGLAASVGESASDPVAALLAAILLATWRVAYGEGIRLLRAGSGSRKCRERFRDLLERGFAGASAAGKGSAYV